MKTERQYSWKNNVYTAKTAGLQTLKRSIFRDNIPKTRSLGAYLMGPKGSGILHRGLYPLNEGRKDIVCPRIFRSDSNMDNKLSVYRPSYEPRRIFGKDYGAYSTRVQCVLPTTGWMPSFSVGNTHDTRFEWVASSFPENPHELCNSFGKW